MAPDVSTQHWDSKPSSPLLVLAQQRLSGHSRGELSREVCSGSAAEAVWKGRALWPHTICSYLFQQLKKKIPTQTPVFNFVNKSYWLWLWSLLQICSVQKRVSLLANSGMQLSSAGRTAESWFVFLATAQTLMGCPLRGGLPRESGLPWRQARC